MPFKSHKQARWAFANPQRLGGHEKVMEWAKETDFSSLPEQAEKKAEADVKEKVSETKGTATHLEHKSRKQLHKLVHALKK